MSSHAQLPSCSACRRMVNRSACSAWPSAAHSLQLGSCVWLVMAVQFQRACRAQVRCMHASSELASKQASWLGLAQIADFHCGGAAGLTCKRPHPPPAARRSCTSCLLGVGPSQGLSCRPPTPWPWSSSWSPRTRAPPSRCRVGTCVCVICVHACAAALVLPPSRPGPGCVPGVPGRALRLQGVVWCTCVCVCYVPACMCCCACAATRTHPRVWCVRAYAVLLVLPPTRTLAGPQNAPLPLYP